MGNSAAGGSLVRRPDCLPRGLSEGLWSLRNACPRSAPSTAFLPSIEGAAAHRGPPVFTLFGRTGHLLSPFVAFCGTPSLRRACVLLPFLVADFSFGDNARPRR